MRREGGPKGFTAEEGPREASRTPCRRRSSPIALPENSRSPKRRAYAFAIQAPRSVAHNARKRSKHPHSFRTAAKDHPTHSPRSRKPHLRAIHDTIFAHNAPWGNSAAPRPGATASLPGEPSPHGPDVTRNQAVNAREFESGERLPCGTENDPGELSSRAPQPIMKTYSCRLTRWRSDSTPSTIPGTPEAPRAADKRRSSTSSVHKTHAATRESRSGQSPYERRSPPFTPSEMPQ